MPTKPPKYPKHLGPNDKPSASRKGQITSALAKMGWHGKDLRQIILVGKTMRENHEAFKAELKKMWHNNV